MRYIGVDAPEKGKPFFEMCRKANRALVENKKVRVQTDNRGQLGRWQTPVYVYAEDDS